MFWRFRPVEVPTILDTLKSRGVRVTVNGDRLRLVPGSRVPEELAETVRTHKAEVLEFLREAGEPIETGLGPDARGGQEPPISSDPNLLAWASELAEQDLTLPERISYVEAPLRPITTERVSHYAALYLRELNYARTMRQSGGWGRFNHEWSRKQEQLALIALRALRDALENRQSPKGNDND